MLADLVSCLPSGRFGGQASGGDQEIEGRKENSEVLHSLAGRSTTSHKHAGLAAILAALTAALTMTLASTAQAAPNVAYAWGRNSQGQLGNGETEGPEKCAQYAETPACSTTPIAVKGLSGVTAVTGGGILENYDFSLALLENGKVMAWGTGGSGQLGNGEKKASDVPVEVTGLSEPVVAIAAGGENAMALMSDGKVVEWGERNDGTNSDAPVEVTGLSEPVKAIAAGGHTSFAVLDNGTVMAWGSGAALGDGSTGTSHVPVAVCAPAPEPCPGSVLSGVSAVSGDSAHSLALLENGTVVAWGENGGGELGDGTETASDVPVAVSGLKEVSAIAAGGQLANGGAPFSLALLKNGKVEAWGENFNDELGDGSHTGPENCGTFMEPCSKKPVEVSGLSSVTAIAARGDHSLALLKGGSVMAWGENKNGQLGDGTHTGPEPCEAESCSATPVAVLTHGSMVGIGANEHSSLAFGPPPPAPTSLPEVGRCVKVEGTVVGKKTVYSGGYGGPNCVAVNATHKGKYEWESGPGSKPKFSASTGSVKLETISKKLVIACSAGTLAGEVTGAKTLTASVLLSGCVTEESDLACQSNPLKEGQMETTTAVEGEVGFITGGEKPVVGLDVKAKSPAPSWFSFECGRDSSEAVQAALEGSVIAPITRLNGMYSEFTLAYKQKGGVQSPERFEGGLKDTLKITSPKEAEKGGIPPGEQIGLNATAKLAGEEPLEVKAKA